MAVGKILDPINRIRARISSVEKGVKATQTVFSPIPAKFAMLCHSGHPEARCSCVCGSYLVT